MTRVVRVIAKLLVVVSVVAFITSQFGYAKAYTFPNFPFEEINVQYKNISPADNACYIRKVPVNISVRFYAFSRAKNALVPYQEISCLYSVDNGEWQNATLHNASAHKYSWYPANRMWEIYVDCYYNATLQSLSNGVHLLEVDFKPDIGGRSRLSSNGKLFASEHSSPNTTLPRNASITFYVFGNNKPNPTAQPINTEYDPLFSIIVLTISVLVTSSLLIYFKKRKNSLSK